MSALILLLGVLAHGAAPCGHLQDITWNPAGGTIGNVLVKVYPAGSTTLATLYTDSTCATTRSQSTSEIRSDAVGNFDFYAVPGWYDVQLSVSGYLPYAYRVEVPMPSLGVSKAGTQVGLRPAINFIDGTGATVTVADDATNNRVNVTVAASSSGGGCGTVTAERVLYADGSGGCLGDAGFTYSTGSGVRINTDTTGGLTVDHFSGSDYVSIVKNGNHSPYVAVRSEYGNVFDIAVDNGDPAVAGSSGEAMLMVATQKNDDAGYTNIELSTNGSSHHSTFLTGMVIHGNEGGAGTDNIRGLWVQSIGAASTYGAAIELADQGLDAGKKYSINATGGRLFFGGDFIFQPEASTAPSGLGKSVMGEVTCSVSERGRFHYKNGAAGVADVLEVCMKNASDVYVWTVK